MVEEDTTGLHIHMHLYKLFAREHTYVSACIPYMQEGGRKGGREEGWKQGKKGGRKKRESKD